ncbi:hypothetical protein Tco_1043126 [Tanacetum coccineum]|uniref:Uncharacterized protein n=1 Tax=Tanacetum coccineum TaxID=301880 RepID=A0ABQ5GLB8_9ASTR
MNDNLISNDYAVKPCLEYEVRKGKKLVKKELMVLLRGEVYFAKFIINHEEDEFEPGLIFGRSFLRSANVVVKEGTITIQPDFDPFLLSSNEEETDLPPLVCKIGKGSRNKKKILENIMYFNGVGPSSSIGTPLTQEEAERRALTHSISMSIYEQLGRDDIMKEERNITMINYTQAEVIGRLVNVLCQVGFTTLFAKIFTTFDGLTRQTFREARSEKIRIAESDSDDEEDYVIKRNEMGTPIYNSRPIGYQNNTNPAKNITLPTLKSVINPFRKISVWKKAISFLGLLPTKLRDIEWKPDYKLCYSNPELATGQWKTEIRLIDPYGNIYMHAFVTKPTKRK